MNSGGVIHRSKPVNESEYTTPPVKTCTKCGHELSATPDFFYRQRDGKYGLRADCKNCFGAVNRVSQQRHYALVVAERLANPQPVDKSGWIQCPYCPDLMPPTGGRNGGGSPRKQCGKQECHKKFQRERCRPFTAAYAARYPEKRRARRRNRRALERNVPGTHTAADVQAQYKRQHGQCFWRKVNPACAVSLKGGYHVDHVVPLGGDRSSSNGPENIVLSCPQCNGSKHVSDPMDWAGVMF